MLSLLFYYVLLFFSVTILIGTSQQHAERQRAIILSISILEVFSRANRIREEETHISCAHKIQQEPALSIFTMLWLTMETWPIFLSLLTCFSSLNFSIQENRYVFYAFCASQEFCNLHDFLDYTFICEFVMHISMYANFVLFEHFLTHKLFSVGLLPVSSLSLFLCCSYYLGPAHAFCLNSFPVLVALGCWPHES